MTGSLVRRWLGSLVSCLLLGATATPQAVASPVRVAHEAGTTAGIMAGRGKTPTGRIVFSSNRDGNYEIYIMNPDGSALQRLTEDVPNQYAPQDALPVLSADGTKIAWVSTRDESTDIWIMNSTGTNQVRLTTAAANTFNTQPAFSPDGTRIAFVSNRTGTEHIFVMHVDGSNQVQLTTGDNAQRAYAPAWSRNGQRIAFAIGPGGSTALAVMNADGSGRELIRDKKGNPINGTNPSFHPNGRQIVFNFAIENGATGSNIGVVRDNGKVNLLTRSEAGVFNIAPVYSPDGRFIAYSNSDIIVMRANGSKPVNRTNAAGSDEDPSWGVAILP
jgi:TolB protein